MISPRHQSVAVSLYPMCRDATRAPPAPTSKPPPAVSAAVVDSGFLLVPDCRDRFVEVSVKSLEPPDAARQPSEALGGVAIGQSLWPLDTRCGRLDGEDLSGSRPRNLGDLFH